MLIANQLSGFGTRIFGGSLHDILLDLGLTSGLQISLDAGDAASYPSGQKWLDLGDNGYDFFRGADGSAASDDPTFNGTAGRLSSSEYWSFDGGDFFRLDQSNPAFVDTMHKNNAFWSAFGAFYLPSSIATATDILADTGHLLASDGFEFSIQTNGKLRIILRKSGIPAASNLLADSTATLNFSAWNTYGITIDEASGSGAGIFAVNGATETFDSTYLDPSSASASQTIEIGAGGNGYAPAANNCRLAAMAVWQGSILSAANHAAIHANIQGRFGI